MGRARQAAIRLLLTIAFARGFVAVSAGPGVSAEARQVVIASGAAQDDPEVVAFDLNFDLHLTNRSQRSFGLPAPRAGKANSVRVFVLGADSKGPDGTWVHLFQGSWYDNGTLSYEPCVSLRPGAEGDVRGVEDGLVLLKKQLPGLGEQPIIRLQVMVFCRQPGGRVLAQEVTTEAFEVRLPSK